MKKNIFTAICSACLATLLITFTCKANLLDGFSAGSSKISASDRRYIAKYKPAFDRNRKVFVYDKVSYKSFTYLNAFRKSPSRLGSKIGLNLKGIPAACKLKWDPILAKAATAKAMDMATNDYFSHTDRHGLGMNFRAYQAGYRLPASWLENRNSNFIESIAANSEFPDQFINQLIIDKNVAGRGHRVHLLALSNFYRKAKHCGIGIVYNPNSKYGYYCSVLIAP